MSLLIVKPQNHQHSGNGFNDWVDRELVRHSTRRTVIAEKDLNRLLELRELISRHLSLEPAEVIRSFFRLRRRLEVNYYLLCYRLRNWIAVHYMVEVSDPLERIPSRRLPLDLTHREFGRLLLAARRECFEHAEALVPWNDLRTRIVRK